MAKVFDDLATKFVSFGDALEAQFGDLSLDLSLPSKTIRTTRAGGNSGAGGDAAALKAAAAEREAAKQRGEEILQQLPTDYFESSFDAVKHELCLMGPDARQDDIDVVVDRLTAAMEVVGMQLARHVLKNQDKLVAGITGVTHVEDDVKAAYVVCQGSRAQLRMAAEEVQRQIRIITSTRKKQHSMELLDVLSRIQKVKDLPAALRLAHEESDHAEAILLCVDCFHAVETLSKYKIAQALQMSVQRAYYDAMQHLHTALLNVCTDFQGENYSRLLEAYLLQGVPPEALAEKVLSCFSEVFKDVSTRLVRSMVLARAFAQQADQPDSPRSSSRACQLEECSFSDLCKRVPPDMLHACLSKLLEAVFDLLASYYSMLTWHEAGLAEHTQAAAAAAAAAASAAARSPGQSQDGAGMADNTDPATADAPPSQEQLDQVQAATKGMLAAVQDTLQANRLATVEAAAVLVKDLLIGAGGCSGTDFYQVVGCCLQFGALAEAFAGSRLPARDALMHILGAFVRDSHKSNMQGLKHALAVETWGAALAPSATAAVASSSSTCSVCSCDVSIVAKGLSSSNCKLPAFGEDGFVNGFADYASAGNPFRKHSRAVGGKRVLDTKGSTPATMPQAVPGSTAGSSNTPATAVVGVSRSCSLVLQWLADYAGLMVILPKQQQLLWAGTTELFDNYLLACFVLFSGVSLQTLVWQDDCLPNRLRSTLLRITTSSNCKYKAEVEELQRTKPAAAATDTAAASSSFLGFGSSVTAGNAAGSTSKLDVFTRRVKNTMVELINTDLSQPINEAQMHSPGMHSSPKQQQQQSASDLSRQQQQQQQVSHAQQLPSTASSSTTPDSPSPAQPSDTASQSNTTQRLGVHATFLQQCVSAIASLGLLADALTAAKPAFVQLLKGVGMTKEVESYFSRTVDAAADLKEAVYLGTAKQLLPGLADTEYGLASAIAECNYNMQQPATRYQPWVGEVLQQFAAFGGFVSSAELSVDVQHKYWEAALKLCAEAMLDGMGQIRRCSQQGRAAMSLDLSAVEKGLRPLAPPSALSSLRRVDTYIKAFYIPWEELSRWAQTHLADYGKARILVLVEAMADAYGIKRSQRATLLDSIRTQLTEFA